MCVVAQAQLDALQTEQPPLSSDGILDFFVGATRDHGSLDTDAKYNRKPQLGEPEQRLEHPRAEVASLQAMCEALRSDLQGARERAESLRLECEHSQSQRDALGAVVAGHLGLESITAGEAAAALAAHQAAHEATTSGLRDAAAAAQWEAAGAQTAHADSLAAAEGRALDLQKQRDVFSEHIGGLETRNAALFSELSSFEERHAGMTDKHTHLQAELAALQSQHADLASQFSSLQEEYASLVQQHEALQQEHSTLQQSSHFVEAQKALNALQTEYYALKEGFAAKEKALAEHNEAEAGSEQLRQQKQQLQVALDTAKKEKASSIQQLEASQVCVWAPAQMPSNLACGSCPVV